MRFSRHEIHTCIEEVGRGGAVEQDGEKEEKVRAGVFHPVSEYEHRRMKLLSKGLLHNAEKKRKLFLLLVIILIKHLI